jgi:EAL and modified HD-GYP domain-containing signal transduction protein
MVNSTTNNVAAPEPLDGKSVPRPDIHFFARQPIFDSEENVFGYELLFRGGIESYFAGSTSTAATRSILDSSTLIGFDILCDRRRAFINCTRGILLRDYVTLLPPAQTVVEVLETVPPDELVMAACVRLKEAGYSIALDGFTVDDPRERLSDLADILKVDVKATSPQQGLALVKRYGPRGCRMLAKKVETRSEFTAAKAAGFRYFQGYFFRKPELLTSNTIPVNRVNHLRLLQAASWPELDPREIEKVIKSEPSFCYRLLRYLNSAVFGFSNEIRSVRHALSMLGENEVRRWLRLVAMICAGRYGSSDLVRAAMVRARLCELLSPKIQVGGPDLFLMGMLSLMDAILEMPMASVLDSLPQNQEIKAVLLGGANRLRPLFQLMVALESGDWHATGALAKQLHLNENEVAQKYLQAMEWARQVHRA